MEKKRVILSAGGTGGHLFPAQVVAGQLEKECELLFVAGGLKHSHYFEKNNYSFEEISAATFSFANPLQLMRGGAKVCKGVGQSRKILRAFKPDLVVGFGSFFTLPLLVAAWMEKIPMLLHEQNALPGRVNRLFSRCARATAITFPQSARHLKGSCIEVDFPIRKSQEGSPWSYFGLEQGKKTLLVFGGSQGARQINEILLQSAERLSTFQILHFVGKHGNVEEAEDCYRRLGINHLVRSFESRIDLAFQAADLVICRAGASTIAELIENERPAILIPFPLASENHQFHNARYFVDEVGGGSIILEKELTPDRLFQAISHLNLERCREQIRQHKAKKEVKDFITLIREQL